MGHHDPEDNDDERQQRKRKQNDTRPTETTTNSSSSVDEHHGPITRTQAHSSSREQADCDKNKQTSDAKAAISSSQPQDMAYPQATSMEQPSSPPTPAADDKSDAIKSTNIEVNMKIDLEFEAASSSNLSEAPAREGHNLEASQFKLPMARSAQARSSAAPAISASQVSNYEPSTPQSQNNQRRRTPQRKASVFSHDGFPALDELDQKSLKQHSILAQSAGDLSDGISGDKIAINNKSHHQQQGADVQIVALQQQVMIAGPSKTGELASAKANSMTPHSPQRSMRSDTLGSTGSSRASSCDEPTIISPLLKPSSKTKKLEEKSLKQSSSPTESSTSSLDSIESDTTPASTIHSADHRGGQLNQSCDNGLALGEQTEDEGGRDARASNVLLSGAYPMPMNMDSVSDQLLERKISNDSSSTRSDEVFDSEAEPLALKHLNKNSQIPPPFESIKNQIKRNSVPDAKTIRQHIDKLISQNEAIMENWNQVSIRSYTSQAAASAAASAAATITETRSANSASSGRTLPKAPVVDTTSGAHAAPTKRHNKQRSSTTALYQGNVFSLREEQLEQLRVQHSINQLANINFAAQDQESRRLTQDNLNDLMSAGLRKHSYNNQQALKKVPVRQTSDTGPISSMVLSPTIHERTSARDLCQNNQSEAPAQFAFGALPPANFGALLDLPVSLASSLRQNATNNTPVTSRESLDVCFNSSARHLAQRAAELARQTSFNQSIESAIENLSLKRPVGQIQQQQQEHQQPQHQHQQNLLASNTNLLQQPEDLMLATLLPERQRHQQLLQDHLFQQQLLHAGKQQDATISAALLDYIQLEQQQAFDQQVSLNRLASLEQDYRQQLNDRFLANPIQQQQANNQNSLMQSVSRLSERQSRESQLLNEFLAKMMLDRDDSQQNQKHEQEQQQQASLLTQIHHNGPILRHSEANDQRPNEMFTQPLDSATPSHRCEACDISFWTKDLLNYHLMTSCSARTGPDSARPLAFNFNQHNGFDRAVCPTSREQKQRTDPSFLSPNAPLGNIDVKFDEADDAKGLDMTNGAKSQTKVHVSAGATFQAMCATQQSAQKELLQSKSTSPPRRRTYHMMDAPDQQRLVIPSKHQLNLQIPSISRIPQQQPVVPKSPTFRFQQLDEMQRLKGEALTSPSTVEIQESSLPIKKRKISEPNMRY